jgi:hypothetical protein
VYAKRGDCHLLVKLDKPFCEHYGFKLDKYVKVSVNYQQILNNKMWEVQEQFKGQNISTSHECSDQFRFPGCYQAFAGCDRSTSVLKPKKICKESCLHFTKECSAFVKMWNDVFAPTLLTDDPSGAALFNCTEKPSRNAGDTPECMHYDRKESVEKEGKFSRSVCRWHIRRAVEHAYSPTVRRLVCLYSFKLRSGSILKIIA